MMGGEGCGVGVAEKSVGLCSGFAGYSLRFALGQLIRD